MLLHSEIDTYKWAMLASSANRTSKQHEIYTSRRSVCTMYLHGSGNSGFKIVRRGRCGRQGRRSQGAHNLNKSTDASQNCIDSLSR